MQPISVIIPCKNEEHCIENALESVKWADEIIVIDSFSTDGTLEIARRYTNNIVQRKYKNSADQKNWIIPLASYKWILLIDADEYITPELRDEIQSVINNEASLFTAYWIYRRNFFMNKEIKYSGWGGDKVIRLFQRDSCRYEDKNVHAEIITDGKIGFLKHNIVHNTYKDWNHYWTKINRYAEWSAMDVMKKVRKPTLYHFVAKPVIRFFKHYFIDRGFLEGKEGFIICCLSAIGVWLRYVKLYEMIKQRRQNNVDR